MQVYKIPNYPDYELHYSIDEQLVYSKRNERYLKLCKDSGGYLLTALSKNGLKRTFKIHQLVWICIKGEIPQGLEINHMDENKENNCIENLELVTHLENMRHGTLQQRISKANKISLIGNQNGKGNSKAIVGIKKDLSEILQYPSMHEAERDVEKGFNNSNISACCLNRKSFKSHKDFIWFYKEDFDSYMNRFQGNLQDVIKYKSTLTK